jgi:hypothetical protein
VIGLEKFCVDSDIVEALKKSGQAVITLSPDSPLQTDPKGCYRFRIETFSIQLSGVETKEARTKNVHIRLYCNGEYKDKLRDGTIVTFVGNPVSILCNRSVEGDLNSIQIARFGGRAYLPALFTAWTIQIVNFEELDLAGLESVNIDCTGKALCN